MADFYAAGMDEKAIEAAGAKPLDDELARIAGIKDQQGLQDEVAHLHMVGVNVMFRFGENQDLHDSSKVIGAAFQGGLGLPDRDYYVKTADKCVAPAPVSGAAPASATSPKLMRGSGHSASLVLVYGASGGVLMLVAALGVIGVGPFAS